MDELLNLYELPDHDISFNDIGVCILDGQLFDDHTTMGISSDLRDLINM